MIAVEQQHINLPGRYRVLAIYGAWNAVMQFEWLRLAPVTDEAAHQLGVEASSIGLLSLLFPLIFVLFAIPSGRWIDKLNVRFALRACAASMLCAAAVRMLATTQCFGEGTAYGSVLFGQTLFALIQPAIMALLARVVLVWFTPHEQLAATGMGTAALFLGVGLAFVCVPLTTANVVSSLLWDVLALAALTGLTFLIVPHDPKPASHATANIQSPPESAPIRTLLRKPMTVALLSLIFLGNGYFNALLTWLEPLLQPRGFDAEHAGHIALLMLGGGMLGMALISRIPQVVSAMHIALSCSALLGSALTLVLFESSNTTLIAICAFLLGVLMLAPLPLLVDAITHAAGPSLAGTALGLFWLSGNAGATVLIGALSPIADHGAWTLGGALLIGLLLIESGVAGLGLRRRR